MAHQWNVIDGDIYVSKNGDDTTGDGSMASPYASINKATTVGADGNKIVIGSGLWQEARGTSSNKYKFYGDGLTIFDGTGSSWFTTTVSGESFHNLRVQDYMIGRYFASLQRNWTIEYYHCWLKNCYTTSYDQLRHSFYYCVLENFVDVLTYIANTVNIYNSTVIRYYVRGVSNNARYTFRMFNSIILDLDCKDMDMIQYDSSSDYNLISKNVIFRDLYDLAYYQNAGYSLNSFSLDPKFNNKEVGNYTLQPDSPCLFAGKNNTNVGALGLGYSFDANSSEFTEEGGAVFSQTTAENDIIRTQQTINGITRFLFQLTAGHASGNVESEWIDLQTIRYLLITRLFANIIYNASGVATSRPDNLETAGEKAMYYDFELKYCNEESEKATATFKNVIWNKAVTIDNSDRGNADGAFVASEAKYISARFVKIKLYMTEA